MALSWSVVPNLDEMRDQLDLRFPNRDKKSDGSIGNLLHQQGSSSHNPDKSGKPEWRDGDKKNEVRARDVDKDLKDPNTTMEQVVQEWVRLARAGKLWWVRYIIYNGRIWHKSDGFKTRAYKGKNKHNEHAHVNSDFTQKADEVKGTDWGLKNFRKPKPPVKPPPPKPTTPPPPPVKPPTDPDAPVDPNPPVKPVPAPKPAPKPPKDVTTDGVLGPETIKLWRYWMNVNVRGEMTEAFVEHLQKYLQRVDHRLKVDGDFGPKTIAALQRYLKAPVDGVISKPKSKTIVALQRRLNEGRF